MIISPSILAADFARLGEEIRMVEKAGADWFHLDIMDGHFVPNISFGPSITKTMRRLTTLPLDVHLMIENPDRYIEEFVAAGATTVSVHVEASVHLNRTLNMIRECGARPGVAINPATPLVVLEDVLDHIDLVCIMSVNPGFGGQAFLSSSVDKVGRIAEMVKDSKRHIDVEVDGGVDESNANSLARAGATVLVAGSAIFGAADPGATLKRIRGAATTT